VVQGLDELGHEVHLVTNSFEPESPSIRTSSRSFLKTFIPAVIWNTLKDFQISRYENELRRRVIESLASVEFDVVLERVSHFSTAVSDLCLENEIPYVIELNAPLQEERVLLSGPSLLSSRAKKCESIIYRRADQIITVSRALKFYVAQEFGIDGAKITSNPNGVSSEEMIFTGGDAFATESMEEGDIVIGFIGSIFKYHGIDVLINAFASLIASVSHVHLLIVGDGEDLEEYVQLTKELKCADRVSFTGSIPHEEVANYINKMDICVMPKSNWYGSPVKIFEYAYLGKPIIAPDVDPVVEVLTPEQDGLVARNKTELFEALKTLLGNPKRAAEMARKFKAKVEREYTWQRNAERVEIILKRALRNG
jgi:glycosyltransferase involved in cell wall biosynthesis